MDVFGRHLSVLLFLLLTFQKQSNGEYQIIKLSYITCLNFILENTKPLQLHSDHIDHDYWHKNLFFRWIFLSEHWYMHNREWQYSL